MDWILNNLYWICPLGITVVFSVINIITTLTNLKILGKQYKMQNDSFCFQLFEKRYNVYIKLEQILCSAQAKGKVTNEMYSLFCCCMDEVKLLFGKELFEVYNEACRILNECSATSKIVEHDKNNPEYEKMCDREYALLVELREKQKLIKQIAERYISFAEYKVINENVENLKATGIEKTKGKEEKNVSTGV